MIYLLTELVQTAEHNAMFRCVVGISRIVELEINDKIRVIFGTFFALQNSSNADL